MSFPVSPSPLTDACCPSDSDVSPGPSSFQSCSCGDSPSLFDRPAPTPDTPPAPPVAATKISPMKKSRKPVLPGLLSGSSDASTGVNPFESGKVRKVRSCECFLDEEDARAASSDSACSPMTAGPRLEGPPGMFSPLEALSPTMPVAQPAPPSRSILRAGGSPGSVGRASERRCRWSADVVSSSSA
eukprot:TRINITY_DN20455_c0_g1_i1.p2 TRINITY_DN20455_c0_g1~~TRINITY_DN20455_c0_g1_i1.p2  ORF type:complete len:186 (+),score=19.45 TRINITY_DN20455_c0_g1_i1:92-649(+)